jgi:5-methylcytosine-specific restriction endonuclease McrA
LDFTTKQNILADQYWGSYSQQDGGYNYPVVPMRQQQYEKRILTSGKQPTKRSVSETKKKYVASSQNWKCGGCGKQLTAWFEVDHKVRLEYGGSNEVSNLVALCRECHGEKTTMENL